jgi:RHS repeat-associated protein
VAYAHDAAGNRTSETRNGQVTTSTYDDAGQLVSVGSKTYTYDEDGNLLQAGSDSFAWDHEDRLTQATVGSHTASYTYDGDGVRVGATVDGVPSSYLVDAQGGLPTLVDDGSKAYLHADGVLGEIGGGTRYALGDALGSVRGLADESGSLVGTASYEAFGAPRTSSGASSLFGFTGEPADATGLVYLRARTLDPATGRFLSADTVIPNAPGTTGYNPYAYAGNDPTTWTDPTGHQIVDQDVLREMLWTFVQAFAQNPELIKGVAATLIGLAATAVGDPRIRIAVAIIGMLVVAAYFLSFSYRYPEGGSGSSGGKTEWTSDELEQAQNSPPPPPPPVPPGGSTGSCEGPQGGPSAFDELYRYCGPKEAYIAGKRGFVPNVDALGRPKNVFYTTDFFTSAATAREVLELPGTPTHRITVDPRGATWCYAGDVEGGTGTELTTQQPLRVISVDPLGP